MTDPTSDDEIIDAEIVEEDHLPTVVVNSPVTTPAPGVQMTVTNVPPGSASIVLNFEQRILIREALAHYYGKGPRTRNTRAILKMIEYMADSEPESRCAQCDNTGKWRDMYDMHYCHCRRGVERRQAGS